MPFRSNPGILSLAVLVFELVLAASARAALPEESAWKQSWWDEASASWSPLGVIVLHVADDRVTAEPIVATYTRRGAILPEKTMAGSVTAAEVRFGGVFGKRRDAQDNPTDRDHVIEFRLQVVDDRTLEGGTFDEGSQTGRTRFARLTESELLGEFEAAAHAWQVERKIVQASLPLLREQLEFLEKQLADDRALGRVGLDGQSTLVLDDTRMQILSSDARLTATSEGERLARELATRLKARFPSVVSEERRPAAVGPGESFWVQHWKNPENAQWTPLGLLHMVEGPDGVSIQPINFTYTSRGAQLPERPLRGRKTDTGLAVRGAFGNRSDPVTGQPTDQPLVLDFDLERTDDRTLAGVIRDGSAVVAETKFVRVADKPQLIDLLQKSEFQWGIERAVVMGTIPSLRDQVSTLEKQDRSERQAGRGGLTPMARINLDHARRGILVEELRLMTTTGGIAGVREMIIRLRELP